MDKKLQLKYSLLQGLFWMAFCITIAYINSYLTAKNLLPDTIGIITAVFGAIAALVQNILGNICDQSRKINWKIVIIGMLIIKLAADILINFVSIPLLQGILFGSGLMVLNTLIPFVNAANFYYEENGKILNYGVARGTGSLLYAVTSFVMGNLIALLGIDIVNLAGLIVTIALLGLTISMPIYKNNESISQDYIEENAESFIKKYKSFCLILVGFSLLMVFHNTTSTYMLQILERVGGSNPELGTTFAIAAVFEIPIMFGFSYIIAKFKSHSLLKVAAIFFIFKGLIYFFTGSVAGIYFAQTLQVFSFALFASASVYYAKEKMSPKDMVKGQTLAASTITIGSVIGNLSGGLIVKNLGSQANVIYGLIVLIIAALIIFIVKD